MVCCPQFFGRVHFRGRPKLLLPKIFVQVRGRCQTGRGKANFFVYGWICVGKRKSQSLWVGLTSPPSKNLFGLREGAKRGGAKLTFLFMYGFEWGKGESCLGKGVNLTFLPLFQGRSKLTSLFLDICCALKTFLALTWSNMVC